MSNNSLSRSRKRLMLDAASVALAWSLGLGAITS